MLSTNKNNWIFLELPFIMHAKYTVFIILFINFVYINFKKEINLYLSSLNVAFKCFITYTVDASDLYFLNLMYQLFEADEFRNMFLF